MAKVKLTLNGRTDLEVLETGQRHQMAMEGNAHFPDPLPDEAAFAAATEHWHTLIQNADLALTAYRQAIAAKAAGRKAYEGLLRTRASYVQSKSGGDPVQIVSSGFDLRQEGGRIGTLPAPRSFLATMGVNRGEMRLNWKRVRGAQVYQAEIRRRDEGDGGWRPLTPCTASKMTVEGLESGVEYAFRVAALGAAGLGPWSDPSFMMAP